MRRVFFTIVILLQIFAFEAAVAQKKFLPGYYLNASEDTIRGFILVRSQYETFVMFRPSLKSGSTELSVDDVPAFGFDDWYSYRRVKIRSGDGTQRTVFAKILVDGSIDLWRPQKGFVLHDDARGTFVLATSRNPNDAVAKENYQTNIGAFNVLFQDCNEVKEAAAKAKIDEKSLRKLLADYHSCKGTTARSLSTGKKVRSFGVYAGVATSNISFNEPNYLAEPEFAPHTSTAFGIIIVKQPYRHSPIAFTTELGYKSAEYKATHYEVYRLGPNEFERYSDINIKFSNIFARFGMRLSARSDKFNPYIAFGIQVGSTIDHGSVAKGTFRVNDQTDPFSEPVPLPFGGGGWISAGIRKEFSKMSIAADFCTSFEGSVLAMTPRIMVLF